jgi:hypothetical protein
MKDYSHYSISALCDWHREAPKKATSVEFNAINRVQISYQIKGFFVSPCIGS